MPLIPTLIISSAIVLLAELSSLVFLLGLPESDCDLGDFELDDADCVFVFEGVDLDFLVGVMTGLISSSSSSNSDPDSEYSRLTTIARMGEYG